MSKVMKHMLAVIALAAFTASGAYAVAADRTADEILKDLDATPVPKLDRCENRRPSLRPRIQSSNAKRRHQARRPDSRALQGRA